MGVARQRTLMSGNIRHAEVCQVSAAAASPTRLGRHSTPAPKRGWRIGKTWCSIVKFSESWNHH